MKEVFAKLGPQYQPILKRLTAEKLEGLDELTEEVCTYMAELEDEESQLHAVQQHGNKGEFGRFTPLIVRHAVGGDYDILGFRDLVGLSEAAVDFR